MSFAHHWGSKPWLFPAHFFWRHLKVLLKVYKKLRKNLVWYMYVASLIACDSRDIVFLLMSCRIRKYEL